MNLIAITSFILAILASLATILIEIAIFGVLTRMEKELIKAREATQAIVFGEQKLLQLIEKVAKEYDARKH